MLNVYFSIIIILIGIIIWAKYENPNLKIDYIDMLSIFLIIFGAVYLLVFIDDILSKTQSNVNTNIQNLNLTHSLYVYFLIFVGSVFYTIASYFHLKLKNWTFLKALLIAIPFVFIEYQFSLRGNFHAGRHLKLNSIQTVIITMCFYFINAWILNYLVLKQNVTWWREIVSFMLIISAFLVSTQKRF
jgi:uncharacterized protein (DUF486 family)